MNAKPLELFSKQQGQGEPIILLHGLFGSMSNLGILGRALSDTHEVHWLDMRNHGQSPHCNEMDFPSMAADVIHYMDQHQLAHAHILGHSMGGKIAMQIALTYPARVDKLIVVDIAPVAYPPRHDDVFQGLFAIRLAELTSRQTAESILAEYVTQADVRTFLMKNLTRSAGQGFAWRMNLQAIFDNYDQISQALQGEPYRGSAFFIKGNQSAYLDKKYKQTVLDYFPNATLRIVDGAGHWLHAEKPETFNRIVLRHLLEGA